MGESPTSLGGEAWEDVLPLLGLLWNSTSYVKYRLVFTGALKLLHLFPTGSCPVGSQFPLIGI